FALANPVGGVAIQTVWLAVADLLYRRANLEHAAASLENLGQSLTLVALLTIPVIAYATPTLSWGWIHPLSLLIPVIYVYSLFLLRRMRADEMWSPRRTSQTVDDDDTTQPTTSLPRLWVTFAGLALVTAGTGWVIGRAGLGVAAATGWPSDVTGFTVTTAISSLPELITLIAAVRMGALTLGVGNIIGGNVFDTLMISIADVSYRDGTIYEAAGPSSLVLLAGTAFMSAVLAIGLLVRDRRGIGFEGVTIPGVYLGTIGLAIVAR
ncbi:MAG TPA: sodium:calcium symporter, partial [Microbacterium sp.]|nr:sodium:calcium symporter [Microbacterium sp.]